MRFHTHHSRSSKNVCVVDEGGGEGSIARRSLQIAL